MTDETKRQLVERMRIVRHKKHTDDRPVTIPAQVISLAEYDQRLCDAYRDGDDKGAGLLLAAIV